MSYATGLIVTAQAMTIGLLMLLLLQLTRPLLTKKLLHSSSVVPSPLMFMANVLGVAFALVNLNLASIEPNLLLLLTTFLLDL